MVAFVGHGGCARLGWLGDRQGSDWTGGKVNVWKLDHVVPASDVDVEEQRLAEVLAKAGYDVGKLSLNALAQQVLAERAKAVVMSIGIEPSNWPHYPLGNGGVEVRFQFSREEDQVNARLALA